MTIAPLSDAVTVAVSQLLDDRDQPRAWSIAGGTLRRAAAQVLLLRATIRRWTISGASIW
jgi:hypothetical protein